MRVKERRIQIALGKEIADVAIKGAFVFNVFTGDFAEQDVLIADGFIAAVLPPSSNDKAKKIFDAKGAWLIPGFIDSHVHIESSMLVPEEFSKAVSLCGVTSVIADPHEIANIFGVDGIRYMLDASENLATRLFFMLPSCVPASSLEIAPYEVKAKDLAPFLRHPRVLGLGELMNFPGVFSCDQEVMDKIDLIDTSICKESGGSKQLFIDGHAPFVSSEELQAYLAAGICSDHEASTPEEAQEKLAAGMTVMLREGSAARNLLSLIPAVTPYTVNRCLLCTDDRQPPDLLKEGTINCLVKMLQKDGRVPLPSILRMASWNAAQHFSLRDTGAISAGYRADFALYPDLDSWKPTHVWLKGELVVENGTSLQKVNPIDDSHLRNSVILKDEIGIDVLAIEGKNTPVRVIGLTYGDITTESLEMILPVKGNFLCTDPNNDIAKLAVFERHKATGRVGVGFVKGFGLKKGAIASTVAHDAHNLIVVGIDDDSIMQAVLALKKVGGGLAVVDEKGKVTTVPLPLGGIFSDKPLEELAREMSALESKVRELGISEGQDPFSMLSFLGLPVIPSLKLIDRGLVDVTKFEIVPVYL